VYKHLEKWALSNCAGPGTYEGKFLLFQNAHNINISFIIITYVGKVNVKLSLRLTKYRAMET